MRDHHRHAGYGSLLIHIWNCLEIREGAACGGPLFLLPSSRWSTRLLPGRKKAVPRLVDVV